MNDLARSQAALAEIMRRATTLVDDAGATDIATEIAAGNERLSPVEQVDIYREQFFLRHIDALRDDFRSIEHLLGDEAFEELARAYLAAHPPTSFTLRDLGHAMEAFVARTAPWSSDPLVADLARTEWAFVEAFDAPSAPPLDPASLARIPEDAWPAVRIALQPAMQRLALGHAAHDYRLAVKKDEHPERPEPAPWFVVVYRGPEALQFIDVEPEAFALLEELARGTPLGEACERVATSQGAAPEALEAKLGGWFQDWTRFGWISRVDA